MKQNLTADKMTSRIHARMVLADRIRNFQGMIAATQRQIDEIDQEICQELAEGAVDDTKFFIPGEDRVHVVTIFGEWWELSRPIDVETVPYIGGILPAITMPLLTENGCTH